MLSRSALRREYAFEDEQLCAGDGERIRPRSTVILVGLRLDVFRRIRGLRGASSVTLGRPVTARNNGKPLRFKSSRARKTARLHGRFSSWSLYFMCVTAFGLGGKRPLGSDVALLAYSLVFPAPPEGSRWDFDEIVPSLVWCEIADLGQTFGSPRWSRGR